MTDKRQPITEEMGIHKAWYDVKPKTPDELAAFVRMLLTEYSHDYGTICHAAAAAALAGVRTINADQDQGGITGFQAYQIMFQFVHKWLQIDGPFGVREFRDMLYPQNEVKFRSIPLTVFGWLQEQAKAKLAEAAAEADGVHAAKTVLDHWQSLVDGKVPFGYRVKE